MRAATRLPGVPRGPLRSAACAEGDQQRHRRDQLLPVAQQPAAWHIGDQPAHRRHRAAAATQRPTAGAAAAAAARTAPAVGPQARCRGGKPVTRHTRTSARVTAATTAFARSAGHIARFQMPPSVTRLPSTPSGVSARAAKAAAPAGSVGQPAGSGQRRDQPRRGGTQHHERRTAKARPASTYIRGPGKHDQRERPRDDQPRAAGEPGDRQGQGQPWQRAALRLADGPSKAQHPGQGGVAEQEGPVPDDESLEHVGVPEVRAGGDCRGKRAVEQPADAPPAEDEDREEQDLLYDVAGQQVRGEDGDEVVGHRPRDRAVGAQRHRRQRLVGQEDHVVGQQVARTQRGAEGEQAEDGARQHATESGPRPSSRQHRSMLANAWPIRRAWVCSS